MVHLPPPPPPPTFLPKRRAVFEFLVENKAIYSTKKALCAA